MSRPPRVEGFDYLGPYRYFVTFCTFDRRDVFNDVVIGHSVLSQFRRTSRHKKFAILAYCLMRDHAHLLFEGRSEQSDFRGLIKSLKQSSGQRHASRAKQRLWQEGYWDRVLRPDDDAKKIARYIVENPVRAGLVQRAVDYPLVGSDVWTLEELIDSLW
jgi:REP element-mobilizing transposase RayT